MRQSTTKEWPWLRMAQCERPCVEMALPILQRTGALLARDGVVAVHGEEDEHGDEKQRERSEDQNAPAAEPGPVGKGPVQLGAAHFVGGWAVRVDSVEIVCKVNDFVTDVLENGCLVQVGHEHR